MNLNYLNFIFDFCRQTMVLVFYLLCIILMMISRPILNAYLMKKGKMAVYSALYFFPILALFHTIIGGLMCNSMIADTIFYIGYHFPMFITNFICYIHRLRISLPEHNHINDFKCCPFFDEIGSKHERTLFIIDYRNEKLHNYK